MTCHNPSLEEKDTHGNYSEAGSLINYVALGTCWNKLWTNPFLYWIWPFPKQKPLNYCTWIPYHRPGTLWERTSYNISVFCWQWFFFSLMPRVHHQSPKGLHSHTGTQLPVSVLPASWQRGRDGRAPRPGSTTVSPEITHITSALSSLAQASHVASPEFSQAGRYNPPTGRKLEHLVNRNTVRLQLQWQKGYRYQVCVSSTKNTDSILPTKEGLSLGISLAPAF